MNLIKYSDNYEDSTASLYHFKRQEPLPDNANLTVAGSNSFKYKLILLERPNNLNNDGTAALNNRAEWKNAQIIVALKYISSFF